MAQGGFWNRQARRSGGYKKFLLPKDAQITDSPLLSIQCFEDRHADCLGDCKSFAPESCGCPCHKQPAVTEAKEGT